VPDTLMTHNFETGYAAGASQLPQPLQQRLALENISMAQNF
jgi:hypothetical protein